MADLVPYYVKETALDHLLDAYPVVTVLVAPMRGVLLPRYLLTQARERPEGWEAIPLHLGYGLPVPIPDLELDESGIAATLSFGRNPVWCHLPWEAVGAIVVPEVCQLTFALDSERLAEPLDPPMRPTPFRPRVIQGGRRDEEPTDRADSGAEGVPDPDDRDPDRAG